MEFTSYKDCNVQIAVALVNSHGIAPDAERLTSPQVLKELLDGYRSSYDGPITTDDLADIRALRERLREVFNAQPERATEILNTLLHESGAHPFLTNHGGQPWHLHFVPGGAPLKNWLTAYTAMGLATVIAEEGFDRLKVCASDTCNDVFVDQSKNRSRRFCSAEVCGNRSSVAAYRQRQKQA